jgi:hypothetical protein
MRPRPISVLVGVLIVLGLGSGDSLAEPVRQTPAAVVRTALLAANKGNYAAADKHLSIGGLRMARRLRGLTGDVRIPWPKNGTIQRIEILKEQMQEWHVGSPEKDMFVSYRLYFYDGTTEQSSFKMQQEDGIWKIHLGA